MVKVGADEWDRLWEGVRELVGAYDNQLVFIGGVAVYLHVVEERGEVPARFVEFSHDGDLYASLVSFADLRDEEEVRPNERFSKFQIVKDGIPFDVYVEHRSGLRVPFSAAAAASVVVNGVRVACLEHLLVLKLDALAARRGSAKGKKDERDVVRLVVLLGRHGVDGRRLAGCLDEESMELLRAIGRPPGEFLTLVGGDNEHLASRLRREYARGLHAVEGAVRKANGSRRRTVRTGNWRPK